MLDIIIIGLGLFCVLNGRSKGFVRVALELGSLVIAFLIASRLGAHTGEFLDSLFNFSDRIKEAINVPLVDINEEVNRIIGVIGYVAIFGVVRFLLAIVIRQTSLINHIPIIGTANKALGALTGFVKGYLIALIAVWLLSFMAVEWAENLVAKSFLAPILLNSFPSMYSKLNILLTR